MALEEIDCPKSRTVSSVGVGAVPGPRALSPPGRRISGANGSASTNATASATATSTATDTAAATATASTANPTASSADGSGERKRVSASLSPPKLRAGAGGKSAAGGNRPAAVEAAAAAAAVRRLYRVREAGGVQATRTPDIMAPAVDVLGAGTSFYGSAEVGLGWECCTDTRAEKQMAFHEMKNRNRGQVCVGNVALMFILEQEKTNGLP